MWRRGGVTTAVSVVFSDPRGPPKKRPQRSIFSRAHYALLRSKIEYSAGEVNRGAYIPAFAASQFRVAKCELVRDENLCRLLRDFAEVKDTHRARPIVLGSTGTGSPAVGPEYNLAPLRLQSDGEGRDRSDHASPSLRLAVPIRSRYIRAVYFGGPAPCMMARCWDADVSYSPQSAPTLIVFSAIRFRSWHLCSALFSPDSRDI